MEENKRHRSSKSHSIFGLDMLLHRFSHHGHGQPKKFGSVKTTKPKASEPVENPKRHHSVSFASDCSTTTKMQSSIKKTGTGTRHYSSASCRVHGMAPQHLHGSVMSLVMARKSATACGGGTMPRRPRRPSTPMGALMHALRNTKLGGKGRWKSMTSLNDDDGEDDEDDSAFVSECSSSSASSAFSSSSASKRDSGVSGNGGKGDESLDNMLPPSPWKFDNPTQDDLVTNHSWATRPSFGHLLANSPRLALQHLRPVPEDEHRVGAGAGGQILCAEGNTQAYLLSLVAPPGARVVNIGRAMGGDNSARRPAACRIQNLHNLQPDDEFFPNSEP